MFAARGAMKPMLGAVLQRFPVISDHSVIQVHSVNRYDREAP
jgi:hypothetical protein